ncbi:MAG: SDR family NAD(P)-dependent oxidoreductase [Acidimicrobiales bacterium]|jgi:NAD(P)-dependent dehydrogenase (short-subunit alcohol dehydrogenase family)
MTWSVGAGIEGRTVVVTGATGGIGRAIAHAFAQTGARVVATDLDQTSLDQLTGELGGATHRGVALDLREPLDRQTLLEAATIEGSAPYALVHTAALLRRRASLDDVTEDDWDTQVDTNLKATFFLCRLFANEMKRAGEGRIVLFTSQSWMTGGFGGATVYATTKGGVVSMSRGLARSYGHDGVTVNAIAPGQINTPMLLTGLDPAIYEKMREETPLGYVGEPEDVAGTAVFLASAHARYITGATINVSGGFLMY